MQHLKANASFVELKLAISNLKPYLLSWYQLITWYRRIYG